MSTSMYGGGGAGANGQAIFTDDVSLQVFMEYLKRLVGFPSPVGDSTLTNSKPHQYRLLERRQPRVEWLTTYIKLDLYIIPTNILPIVVIRGRRRCPKL